MSTVEQATADPVWSFANGRPTITSGDGRFSLSLRTRFQFDMADFMQKRNLPSAVTGAARDLGNGAVIRRAYFGVEGRAFQDFWYEFRLNLGGSNDDGALATGNTSGGNVVSLNASDSVMNLARIAYVGIPNFRINAGVIQPIFTLDDTVSSGQIMFIERAEINNIATDLVRRCGLAQGHRTHVPEARRVDPRRQHPDLGRLHGQQDGRRQRSQPGHRQQRRSEPGARPRRLPLLVGRLLERSDRH